MDIVTGTEINESPPPPPPPPPIFLTSPINFVTLCKNLEQITKNEGFLCKSNSKTIKINLHSASSYRAVISLFNENKLEYHTYQSHEEKSYRVVIRNLHHTIPTDYIKDEIEKHGFMVKNVTNILKSQSKEPLPLFFVDLNPSPNNQDIFKINNLCFSKVKFEAPHIRRDLVQCHRCQQYGHTKSYCNHLPKCVRCGDNHTSDQCSKPKDLPAKCALCSNAHPANYRGCTVHKDLQRLRKKHQPNSISREIAQNSDSSQIQHNSHPHHEASQHLNNAPTTTHNEPINTQHTSYSQAVIGNKSKSDFNNTNDHIPNQKLSNQLTSFISEFKTLISPLITLLNPLITLLTSLINKLSSNNGN